MTDAELIARLRDACRGGDGCKCSLSEAADRIEALVKERDKWIEHTRNAVWSDSEELKLANARAERLETNLKKALETLEFISDDLEANLERVTLMARATVAALKGDDHVGT